MTKQNEKDAKRVPELRFKGFTDDWEQVEFGHKIYRRTKSEMSSNKLPGVEYEDINSGQGTLNKDITKKSIRKRGIFFQPFDVLFGKLRPYLKNWLYPNFKGVAVGDFWVLYSKLLEPSFIYGMIQTQKFQNVANLSSGSKMPRSDWKLVSRTLFRFPMNKNEQRKIGLLLLNLDKTITLHEEKQRQLERLKKALLQKMFADETGYPVLRFKGFTNTWEQRKLGALASFSKGSGYSKKDLTSEGIPVILYGRLYTDYETIIKSIDTFSQKKKSSVYSTGRDVIVPASGETAEDIARASVVSKKGVALGSDLNIITPTKNIDPTFLALSISNGTPHKEMAKRAQGKSIVHLHNADLVQIMLKYPSLREQKKVSQQFEKLDYLTTLHQHKIDNLKRLKRALLQKMFV